MRGAAVADGARYSSRQGGSHQIQAPLSVAELGFSLHAATTAGALADRAHEALCKYILRPPIANEHVQLLPDDLVRLQLKRPFRDGTVAVEMAPVSLLCRLAAIVPPPGQHQIPYAGVLAAAAKWRPLVVPPPPTTTTAAAPDGATAEQAKRRPDTHRCVYRSYVDLIRRTFAIDREHCPRCGGVMKLRAIVTKPESIMRILHSLGESTVPPAPPPLAALPTRAAGFSGAIPPNLNSATCSTTRSPIARLSALPPTPAQASYTSALKHKRSSFSRVNPPNAPPPASTTPAHSAPRALPIPNFASNPRYFPAQTYACFAYRHVNTAVFGTSDARSKS